MFGRPWNKNYELDIQNFNANLSVKGYFLGACFSKIRSFNYEFKTKSFAEGNLSLVEAPWQPFTRTNNSPQPPFLIVEMVYWM